MGCEGFNTCYGLNCGGGAVEQSNTGYDSAGGLHPKCLVTELYPWARICVDVFSDI